MIAPADARSLQRSPAVLRWASLSGEGEEATSITGSVTVTVTRDNRTALVTDAAATTTGGAATYTLAATHTQLLDLLTATWKIDGQAVATTTVEIVGGLYATVGQLRTLPRVAAQGDFVGDLVQVRTQAEQELEELLQLACVPRYRHVRIDVDRTSREIVLPDFELRAVRSAVIEYDDQETYALTAEELTAIPADPAGVARRTDGDVWPANTVLDITYEHGLDRPPQLVVEALYRLVEHRVESAHTALGSGVAVYTPPDGGTVNLAAHDSTVERAVQRYGRKRGGFG